MLLFPVRRSGLDWCSGVEPFQRQGFEFFGPVLVCLHQTFQVSLNAQSFGLRAGADFRLEVPIDGKTHVCLPFRSEEHTSELQSLTNLVCRLLLEKTNNLQLN